MYFLFTFFGQVELISKVSPLILSPLIPYSIFTQLLNLDVANS